MMTKMRSSLLIMPSGIGLSMSWLNSGVRQLRSFVFSAFILKICDSYFFLISSTLTCFRSSIRVLIVSSGTLKYLSRKLKVFSCLAHNLEAQEFYVPSDGQLICFVHLIDLECRPVFMLSVE
jgi:hypothetical protein